MKKWLEGHKIYFETIVMFSLTLMGTIISLVGVMIAKDANKLVEIQIEAEEAENAPMFISYSEYDAIDELEYIYIRNTGGEIRQGDGSLELVYFIEVENDDKDIYSIAIYFNNCYTKNTCDYNYDNEEFIFIKNTKNTENKNIGSLEGVVNYLEETINNTGVMHRKGLRNYFKVHYFDYKNQEIRSQYQIIGGFFCKDDGIKNVDLEIDYDIGEENCDEFCNFIKNAIKDKVKNRIN